MIYATTEAARLAPRAMGCGAARALPSNKQKSTHPEMIDIRKIRKTSSCGGGWQNVCVRQPHLSGANQKKKQYSENTPQICTCSGGGRARADHACWGALRHIHKPSLHSFALPS